MISPGEMMFAPMVCQFGAELLIFVIQAAQCVTVLIALSLSVVGVLATLPVFVDEIARATERRREHVAVEIVPLRAVVERPR